MLELSKSFELEIQPLDNDHRKMIDIVNRIVAMIDGGEPQACETMVPEFVAFAKKHFKREEALLEKASYPNLDKHYRHHRALDDKMETMLKLAPTAAANNKVALEALRKEIIYFLMDDVINADLDFKPYFAAGAADATKEGG